MIDNARIPKRRFKEFQNAGDWEQRKVGSIATDTYGGGTPSTSKDEYWNGSIPWIQSSDLTEHQVSGVIPRKQISKEGMISSAAKLVPENSLAIITRVGVGKLSVMPFPFATSQDFLSLSKLKTDIWFSAYLLYKKMQSELNSVQGTSIKGITKDELLVKVVSVPERREQEAIGTFFCNLDNLITLHQRKLDKAIAFKKSCLSEMFPCEGQQKPRRRLAGFTDPWKQRKVSDIASVVVRPIDMKDDEEYQLVTVKRRNEGVVSRGILKGKDILVKNYFEVFAGDFIISKRQVIHGANGFVPESLDRSVVSNEYLVIVSNNEITSKFWTLLSRTHEMYRMFFLSSYGVDIEKMVFNVADWKKRSITIPLVSEQNKIVELFERIDDLITLHQSKLEKLKSFKKACLSEMFV